MGGNKCFKCKLCGKKYISKQALIDHIEKYHSCNIPEGWNAARYENFLRTGKTEGHCVYCKKETGWNDVTGKYNRMCGSEECKKTARELANKNYIGLHGKPYSINNPEQQKKMVYGRKNSGTYVFEDPKTGKKYKAMYDSSYGKDFFEMLDTFLNWDGSDIIAPSPHTYYYEYEGKKHFYIPDAYSTSLNLEIELKDGGNNPNKHPKILAVDKVKEQKKDAVMLSLKDQVNYIKICNKDYSEFFALLSELKEKDSCQLPKWEGKLESISESVILSEPVDDNEILYRLEYDGVGSYEAFHNRSNEEILAESKDERLLLVKRYALATDPTLNYNKLLEYYRKKIFYEKPDAQKRMMIYNELLNTREYLKKVINDKDGENDQRLNYEAKKALVQIDKFIMYMEDTNYTNVKESTVVNESLDTNDSDSERKYPVFILLSYTHTIMSKLIKSYTHDPYVHASISFSSKLDNMISFNSEGLVIENIYEDIWDKGKDYITYSLYVYMANIKEYLSMKKYVDMMLEKKGKLKYNVLGVIDFVFGRGSDREDKFFCSEFVTSVINAGNEGIIKTKAYTTSPYMLAKNKHFKFVKKGILKNYNPADTDKFINKLLEKGGNDNE